MGTSSGSGRHWAGGTAAPLIAVPLIRAEWEWPHDLIWGTGGRKKARDRREMERALGLPTGVGGQMAKAKLRSLPSGPWNTGSSKC